MKKTAPAGQKKAQQQQAVIYPLGIKIAVTPDETLIAYPDHLPLPKIGLLEWVPRPEGGYDPKIRLHSKWIRLYDLQTRKLDIGISYASMRRLCIAEFVKSRRTTPDKIDFDLQSYFQHCAAVEADPEFWTGKNLRRYMEAIE